MFNVTDSLGSNAAMTRTKPKPAIATVKDLLLSDPDSLREVVRAVMQEMLEAEMSEALAVEMANRESRSSWKDFLIALRARGLHGVEFVVADDHAGLRAAIREVLTDAAYQRCYVHFLRNALDHLPRKADDVGLAEYRRRRHDLE